MIVYLNDLGKCSILKLACINIYKWYSMMKNIFFRTLFEISSESNALFEIRWLIASHICRIMICALYEIFYRYITMRISVRSVDNDLRKKTFWNALTFYSFIIAWLLKIDINIDIGILIIYFLIWNMILLLTLFTYSFHLFLLMCAISFIYSFAFSLHLILFTAWYIHLNIFLNQFASFLNLNRSAFHYCLLYELEHLRDVVFCITLMMISINYFAWLSISIMITSSLIRFDR